MALTKVSRGLLSTGIVDNSTTTAITIDSSENVGIGQAPSAFSNWKILELKGGTAGAMLNFENSSSTRVSSLAYDDGSDSLRIQNFLANPITFETSNTERMRIDSSGNLLVGKTAFDDGATKGFTHYSGGGDSATFSTRSSNPPLNLNRLDSDGEILRIRRDGTTVGSIASISNDLVIYSSTASHAGLSFGNTRIEPTNNQGVIYNGGIDLGNTDSRFKDIYLSSGANINGVGVVAPSGIRFVVYGSGSGGAGLYFGSGILAPTNNTGGLSDNTVDLGTASFRFNDAFVTNGVTAGSDGNLKQDIEALSDAEQRVAVACKGLLRKFRWIDAVEAKGDDARIHFGIIAQDLQAAFEAEGLDAARYAMFTSNTWWETQTEVAAVEAVEATEDTEAIEAVDAYTRTDTYDTAEEAPEGATERTRLGIRYSELLAFIISAI